MGSYKFLFFEFTGLLICFLLSFNGVEGGVSCPAHISGMKNTHKAVYKDTCFLFVNKEVYWKTARDSCWELGGEMLAVKDKGTMEFIRKRLGPKHLDWRREGVWLGARYRSRRWRWTDGSEVTYENWASGQPSKVLSIFSVEDCAQMRRDDGWKWHDYICGSLKFHYNYICQFPGITVTTKSTEGTPLIPTSSGEGIKEVKAISNMLNGRNGHFKELNSKPDDTNSGLYRRLGHKVHRLMIEKGMSSKSLLNLLSEDEAMGNSEIEGQEQVTHRVASSASNQEEDNGNMTIVIIVVSLTSGFLFILLLIYLLMRRHNKKVKAKAAERAVCYANNHSNANNHNTSNAARGGVVGGTARVMVEEEGGVEQRPPPIPATRPPPIEDLYLQPKDINGMYTEVLRPNGTGPHYPHHQTNGHCTRHNNYHQGNHLASSSSAPTSSHLAESDSELGACARSLDHEESSPLISGHALNSSNGKCAQHNNHSVAGPTESCTCVVNSNSMPSGDGSEYMAMNSLVSNKEQPSSCDKLVNSEDKHTYSNVHLDAREGTAVENHYETLP